MQCSNCTNLLKEEGYNQQWGMIQFFSHCIFGINKKVDEKCDKYNAGNPQIKYMSERDKRNLPI